MQDPVSRLLIIGTVTLTVALIDYNSLLKIPTLSVYSRLGIPSPSIGLTRAYWYLLHGKWLDAYNMNRLVYLVAAVLIVLVIVDAVNIIRNKIRLEKKTEL